MNISIHKKAPLYNFVLIIYSLGRNINLSLLGICSLDPVLAWLLPGLVMHTVYVSPQVVRRAKGGPAVLTDVFSQL